MPAQNGSVEVVVVPKVPASEVIWSVLKVLESRDWVDKLACRLPGCSHNTLWKMAETKKRADVLISLQKHILAKPVGCDREIQLTKLVCAIV